MRSKKLLSKLVAAGKKSGPRLGLIIALSAVLAMGAVGCGAKTRNSEDLHLSPVTGNRGSDCIIFLRNDSPEVYTTGKDRYFIVEKPGAKPVKIDKELGDYAIKSPTSNSLVYEVSEDRNVAIALYDIDTGSETVFPIEDIIEGNFGIDMEKGTDFSWAPDGKSLYIGAASQDTSGSIVPHLFHFHLDSGSCTELSVEGSADGPGFYFNPITVSPSGTRVLFGGFCWCGDLDERSVHNIRRVFPESTETNWAAPVWLNDHEIVYIEAERNLVRLDIDTGARTVVLESTPEMTLGWAPRSKGIPLACSPQGDRILFPVLTNPEKYAEAEVFISPLYIVNVDGTGLTQVTNPEKDGAAWGDTWPCWASR